MTQKITPNNKVEQCDCFNYCVENSRFQESKLCTGKEGDYEDCKAREELLSITSEFLIENRPIRSYY